MKVFRKTARKVTRLRLFSLLPSRWGSSLSQSQCDIHATTSTTPTPQKIARADPQTVNKEVSTNASTPRMDKAGPVTAAQRALGIAELLEVILKDLSLGDVLYNAQAVSKFWKNCIRGSGVLTKKCFLAAIVKSEETTDHELFLDPAQSEIFLMQRHRKRITEITGHDNPTLANIRKFVSKDPHTNFTGYMESLVIFWKYLGAARDMFSENCRQNVWPSQALQLRASAVHPFINLGLWAANGCFWTGYGSHAVLFVYDTPNPEDFRFGTVSSIIIRAHDMIQDCPGATWIRSSVAAPSFTAITLSVRTPVSRSFGHVKSDGTTHRKTGVTIRDLLMLIAKVTLRAFQDYEHVKICSIWAQTNDESSLEAQRAERKICEVREKLQPVLTAAKELKDLLDMEEGGMI